MSYNSAAQPSHSMASKSLGFYKQIIDDMYDCTYE